MYCKNCGKEMDPNAAVCVNCGAAKGNGASFCPNCGEATAPGAAVCIKCGYGLNQGAISSDAKSKLAAGLLGIFLGSLGVHNFYLGYKRNAIIQLVVTLVGYVLSPVTCGITALASAGMGVWGLVEGIMILTGKINVDGEGRPLKD